MTTRWQPTATRERLRQRAALLATVRRFFAERDVLEVETPFLVETSVTDVNLEPIEVVSGVGVSRRFVHTSPEYAMKRLLAAGSGDIYQLCRVARANERSRLHNPEFTMVEWYRSLDFEALIREVAALLDALMHTTGAGGRPLVLRRYAETFEEFFGVDPLCASDAELAALAAARGLADSSLAASSRDDYLDFLVGAHLGPTLGHGQWLALTHYPASQAALAELDPQDPRVALRFELYAEGIELANGFRELGSAREQRARFEADNHERRRRGLSERALDERLLRALAAGLPACSGVALGFDRCVLLATGADRLDDVLAFPWEIA